MKKEKNEKKVIVELDELEKVTGGVGLQDVPKKKPGEISSDTKKNI